MSVFYGRALTAGGKPQLKFTYSGNYVVRDDGVVELRSSGTLVFLSKAVIDVFLVGGGGSGASTSNVSRSCFGGGGGGHTKTLLREPVSGSYDVTIGAGGATNIYSGVGNSGGSTSFGNIITAGGGAVGKYKNGGSGGSGGGGGLYMQSRGSYTGAGGADGNSGSYGYTSRDLERTSGGAGQGTTTREFGETTGKLYAGGGGGGYAISSYYSGAARYSPPGGSGGGGAGGFVFYDDSGTFPAADGEANTGGGGGGGPNRNSHAGNGGSGIVCFRLAA